MKRRLLVAKILESQKLCTNFLTGVGEGSMLQPSNCSRVNSFRGLF